MSPIANIEGETMTYKNWMKRNYADLDSPEGDLARDVWNDETFPKNRCCKFKGWHDLIKSYLERKAACTEAISLFEKTWKEYEACEKQRLRRN